MNPDYYFALSTCDNFFDAVLKNAQTLKDHYRTVLNAVIYQRNLGQVNDLLQISYGLDIPMRITPALPVGKGKDVKLLTAEQVDRLKGLLLVEKIQHPEIIDSPLVHEINCPVLAEAYALEHAGVCPAVAGKKQYYNSQGRASGCEFQVKGE